MKARESTAGAAAEPAEGARKAVILGSAGDLDEPIRDRLAADGWRVEQAAAATPPPPGAAADALVFASGLADHSNPEEAATDRNVPPPFELLTAVERWRPALRAPEQGGASIVAVGSSENLGWGRRPRRAAGAASLSALTRSLALSLARHNSAVNLVCRLATPDAAPAEPPYPSSLLPGQVQAIDVASAVAFFADPRSRFITGQVLYCCGGATLLSSPSV